jgi:hypothetical protein
MQLQLQYADDVRLSEFGDVASQPAATVAVHAGR